MMSGDIHNVIQEIGWDSDFTLPTANEENAALETEVKTITLQADELRRELNSTEDRTKRLEQHMKNVQNELAQTMQLVKARQTEIEGEQSMLHLSFREDNWLQQDMLRIRATLEDLETKKQRHETLINKHQQTVGEINADMQLDEKTLEDWLEETARHDDDTLALQRYTKQDEAKIKELVLQVKFLGQSVENERQKLKRLINESLCAQMEMDKIAEEYRKLHKERQTLIHQWETSITQMKDRDEEINSILGELNNVKKELTKKKDQADEKQQFWEQMKAKNSEIENITIVLENTLAKFRILNRETQTQLTQAQDEIVSIDLHIINTGHELETVRADISQRRKFIADMESKCVLHQAQADHLQEMLKRLDGDVLSGDEKFALSENVYQEQQLRHKSLELEISRMMELRFRKNLELEKVNDKSKILEGEVQGSRNTMQNMKKRITELERIAHRQDEVIYGQDILIQQYEDRISRMTGTTNAEEKQKHEENMAELQAILEKKEATQQYLKQQIKLLQDDINHVKQEQEKQLAVKTDLDVKMEDITMYVESAEQCLKNTVIKKQNLMVEENLIKLHIKKLQEDLLSKADQVYSMEKRKLQLETAIKERRHDIELQRDMLRAQLKLMEDERQILVNESINRTSKINNIKARYEVFIKGMESADDCGEDNQDCHMQYFIKAVNEKQKLELEGDELDVKVRKAEQEVLALENTLRLLNSKNDNLRRNFNPVAKSTEEYEEKQRLEQQLCLAREKLRLRKQEQYELNNNMQKISFEVEDLATEENGLQYNYRELKDHLATLGRQLEEQYNKLDRATMQNSKYTRTVRLASKNPKAKTNSERDIDLRLIREANKNLLRSLERHMTDHPEIVPETNNLFLQSNLPAPKAIAMEADRGSTSSSYTSASTFCSSHGSRTSLSSRQSSPPSLVNITFTESVEAPKSVTRPKRCSPCSTTMAVSSASAGETQLTASGSAVNLRKFGSDTSVQTLKTSKDLKPKIKRSKETTNATISDSRPPRVTCSVTGLRSGLSDVKLPHPD